MNGPLPDDQVVNGRRVWRQALDRLLAESENVEKFVQAMQELIDESPIRVFKEFVMPLLPKEVDVGQQSDDVVLKIELVDAESNNGENVRSDQCND